jgi:hypothetical protein
VSEMVVLKMLGSTEARCSGSIAYSYNSAVLMEDMVKEVLKMNRLRWVINYVFVDNSSFLQLI